jgi:hypothetical protein
MSIDALVHNAIELNAHTQEMNNYPPKLARLLGLKSWKRFEELTLLNLNTGKTTGILLFYQYLIHSS